MRFKEFYKKVLLSINTRGNPSFDNIIKDEARSVYDSYISRKENLDDLNIQNNALNATTFRAYLEINERLNTRY